MSAAGAGCPAWCSTRKPHGPEGIHTAAIGHTGEGFVSLAYQPGMGEPQIHVSHHAAADLGLMLPCSDAPALAGLLAALGHEDMAALVRQAVEAAAKDDAE